MNEKMITVPYTILIIKPNLVVSSEKVKEIMEIVDKNEFDVFKEATIELTKHNVMNLFPNQANASYLNSIIDLMTSGSSKVLVLVNRHLKKFDEEKNEDIPVEEPILRTKKMIGDKDPAIAKANDPESLRAVYGIDIIKNGFFSSDSKIDANREREVLNLQVPQNVPPFEYIPTKVKLDDLIKFVFPKNLEHPDTTGRLDLFGLFGPIVNWHSIERCFCQKCYCFIKKSIDKNMEIQNSANNTINSQSSPEKTQAFSNTKVQSSFKLKKGPIRLVKEADIDSIRVHLCEKCKEHVDYFTHLPSGREGQYLVSDIEINQMVSEINKSDIYKLLEADKGTAAKTIIDLIDLKIPKELEYTEELIRELFSDLYTDYYERMEFSEMQKKVLEDRRLRLNYWMAKITKKPIEEFKDAGMFVNFPGIDRISIKSPYYREKSIFPLCIRSAKKNTEKASILGARFDKYQKYYQIELDEALQRTVSYEGHLVSNLENLNNPDVARNTTLLRPYNPGDQKGWDNYCCFKKVN